MRATTSSLIICTLSFVKASGILSVVWCHSCKFTYLIIYIVTCRSPRGPSYRSTLGTRCDMKCDPGYRLIGRNAIQCLANRRWSGTAICQMRCHVLPLAYHGSYTCSQGFMVDSRCDFRCDPGYRFEGEHSRTCLKSGLWSGVQPVCSDMDPPKIKCPLSRLKFAQPGKLVATVSWDRPVASDTADKSLEVILVGPEPGSEFKEGPTIIRYKVYDQAKNRAACKFIVRVEGNYYFIIMNGWATIECSCFNYISLDLKCSHSKTASSLLDQFYEKRRLLIVSAPNITDPDYQLQNMMIQTSDCGLDLRHVTVVELLGSPPRETGRIKEDSLTADAICYLNLLKLIFRLFIVYLCFSIYFYRFEYLLLPLLFIDMVHPLVLLSYCKTLPDVPRLVEQL
uniref:Sushi repeat-containing protein SRPX2 n=1 Tax=Periophthalmus magnuspinnatus TaxID=409849 RepID=A0A3B4AZP9_9GOBI